MKPRNQLSALFGSLALGLVLVASAPSARANVYVTNIKLNGGMTNLAVAPGASLAISYILNERASAGVTIKILSGSTPVRTLSLAAGAPGTLRGLNANVLWDGKDDHGQNVPPGTYTVSITAAATGYPRWTAITDDTNPGNYAWESRGIAVDKNPRSPYYGRIFVGNAIDNTGNNPSPKPGDAVGILKLNADASFADEGGFETGGVAWASGQYAPWRIRISADDQVYVGAFYQRADGGTNAGDIHRFDGTLSSNSMLHVFAPPVDNSLGEWAGFCVTGTGTNTLLWGADDRQAGSLGIRRFAVKADGTFDPRAGAPIVGVGNTADLNVGPFAVAVDGTNNLYTLQYRDVQSDSLARVFRFPAYDPSTNNGVAETKADWMAGPGDDYCGAHGLAVDPTGTYVAVCFWGWNDSIFLSGYNDGNIKLLYATNGLLVTNLDLGIAFPTTPGGDARHMDTDCDWDAVGNLYYLDDWTPCWRAFSPPGANQATTVALPVVQVTSGTPPSITSISVSNGTVVIHFTGDASEAASNFGLYSASHVAGPYAIVSSAVMSGSGGAFQASVSTNGPTQFYRIGR